MRKIKALVLAFVFLNLALLTYAQESGMAFIRNYKPWEYKASQQNWMTVQDHRGIMYFANNDGLLEYDGVNWRLFKLPGVRSLAIEKSTNLIYLGLENDIGYVKPDSTGNYQFHSLKDKLPANERDITTIFNLYIVDGKVLFSANDKLYIYSNNKIKIYRTNQFYHLSFVVNDKYYIREQGRGLLTLVGDSLVFIEGSERFGEERVDAMLPYKNGNIMMVTRNTGIVLFYPRDPVKFINGGSNFDEVNSFFLEKRGYIGKALNNGHYAVGSSTGGVIIFRPSGKIVSVYDRKAGLQDNTVFYLYPDKNGQLWVALDNGISLVNSNLPLRLYNDQVGLNGSPICLKFWNGKFYVGTSQHMHVRNEDGKFEIIEGTVGQNFQLYDAGDDLLIAHNSGLMKIEGKKAIPLSTGFSTLSIIPIANHPDKIMVGTIDGLYIFKKEQSKWILKNKVTGFDKSAYMIAEDKDGSIWISTLVDFYRLKIDDSLKTAYSIEQYNAAQGLPSNYCSPFTLNSGEIAFGTEKGIYAYDSKNDKFIPHPVYSMFSGKMTIFNQEPNGDIWFDERVHTGNFERGLLRKVDVQYLDYRTPFKKFTDLGSGESWANVAVSPDNKVYFGTPIGLLQYDPSINADYKQSFNTLIRRVTSRDSIVYNGNKPGGNDFSHVTGIEIPFIRNSVVINFASTSFEDSERNLYSYRLVGADTIWSNWIKDNKKEFSNLSEGSYRFEVRSKNQYGAQGSLASYSFIILPPWYRTWWAYLGYIIITFSVIYILVHWRTRKFKTRSRILESIVLERTREIQEQKNNIEKLSQIGRDITSSLSLENIIQTIYTNVNMLMDASIFTIGLHKPESRVLEFPTSVERNELLAPFTISLDDDDRLAAWCFNHKKEVVINSYAHDYKKYVNKMAPPIAGETPESIMYFPLWNKNKIIGVISAQSFKKNAYTDYHVNVFRNLATYSAIALENADAYKKLASLFNDLKSTQDRLVTQSKLAALGELTAGIAHEIQNPLNFVNNFSEVSSELLDEMKDELTKENLPEVIDIIERLKLIMQKINHHGKRADAIVKGMLQHSASSGGIKEPTDINILTDEFLRLSYHGLRAKDNSFNAELKTDFDQSIGKIEVAAQDIGRAILNLITNSFYAVSQKQKLVAAGHTSENNYKPAVSITTKKLRDSVEIKVSDNGIGIPPSIMDKIFQPFFTTKPPGEGTGLGLSLSYDIITKGHGGQLKVETKEGEGSTFLINLPIKVN